MLGLCLGFLTQGHTCNGTRSFVLSSKIVVRVLFSTNLSSFSQEIGLDISLIFCCLWPSEIRSYFGVRIGFKT